MKQFINSLKSELANEKPHKLTLDSIKATITKLISKFTDLKLNLNSTESGLDIINEKPAGENSPEFEAMSSCTEENVLVIDAMRFHHASVGGDVKFLNLYMNKAEGVVTDGSIRDLNEVKKYNFKIFSAGRTGSIGIPDVWPYEANVTISCGEAVVKPDDLIVGDDDGVVVVPNFIINEVLMWCEKHQEDEKIIVRTHPEIEERLIEQQPAIEQFKSFRRNEYRNKRQIIGTA